jgi:nucleoid DNA-binding protein
MDPSASRRSGPPPRAPRTVTKKELVTRLADRTGQTKVVVRDVIQMLLDEIARELARGNRIEFREFGVFETKERASRTARNPRTLVEVDVPSRRVVKFKVGRLLREEVGSAPDPAARPEPPSRPPTGAGPPGTPPPGSAPPAPPRARGDEED